MKKLALIALLACALLASTIALPAAAAPKGGGGGGSGGDTASGPDDSDLPGPRWPVDGFAPGNSDNAVLKWNEELLQTIRANAGRTGPTGASRALGVLHTAMYDAWTAYDATAGGVHSRPNKDFSGDTPAKKQEAISHAAYQALTYLFPDQGSEYAAQLNELGYASGASSPAAQVGRDAADAVIAYRKVDGSTASSEYEPANTWDTVTDPWKWQSLCVPLSTAGESCEGTIQNPLAPQWGGIKAFAITATDDGIYNRAEELFWPPGVTDEQAVADTATALTDTSNLSDTRKVKAEYWADGPGSEFPPGHWAVFAQAVSRKRGHTLDQDVKLFFALGNAIMDAGVGAWKVKYEYDFVRPITAIREQYRGQMITSWLGPYQGYGKVPGEQWQPYQHPGVVTPPFPEYVSGHSTFSAAAHMVLVAFTGSDTFRARTTIKAGDSLFEGRTATQTGVPAKDVVLSWNTFTEAADEAGWSRRWGGIHFKSGDEHGRTLGKAIGWSVWNRAQEYVNGAGELITP
jgi:hypothetical protein